MPNYEATIKVTIFGVKNEQEAQDAAEELTNFIPPRVLPDGVDLPFSVVNFESPTVSIISN